MKRISSILISALLITNFSMAQVAKYSSGGGYKKNTRSVNTKSPFSFKIGYNVSNVNVSPEPIKVVGSKNGFHIGVVANDISIGDHIALQPELLFSTQGFKVGGIGNVGLNYLSLPVLVKFDMGSNVSLLLGPQVSYLINSKIGIGNDLFTLNYDGIFQKWDFSGVAGAEYKVNEKLTLGGRYLLGLNNINKDFDFGIKNSLKNYFTLKNSTAQFYITVSL